MQAAIIDFRDYSDRRASSYSGKCRSGRDSYRHQTATGKYMSCVDNSYRSGNNRKNAVRRRGITPGSLLTVVLIMLAAVISGVFISSRSVSAVDRHMYKYYTVVEADQGDSLWTIAEDNITPGYRDCNDLIDEIASINHLSDTHIDAGQKLVIPYYSTESRD